MKTEEHWRVSNEGNFGLLDINTKKVYGDNLWTKVEMVIQAYAKVHPQEIREQIEQNSQIVNTRKNDFAVKGKLRWGLSMPVGLLFKIEQVEPNMFSNKKLMNEFMKRYKGFRVCQRV